MKPIPEELVEHTWQEVTKFSPARATKEMLSLGENQPALLSFMMEFTQDLDQEVQEFAVYMFFIVYRIFQKAYKKKIKEISPEEIIECFENNENFIEKLEGVHDKFYERIAKVQISGQPSVMKYVVETLFESDEEDDPISLTEEDIGYLFILFKTVIDLMNDKTT